MNDYVQYRYKLKNLDCANCANKIEDTLKKNKNFKNVSVNFSKGVLKFETSLKNDVISQIRAIIKNIEPEVIVLEEDDSHDHEESSKCDIYRLILGIVLISIALIFKNYKVVYDTFTILAYIVLLYKTCLIALKTLFRSKSINENFLITVSTIGAYLIGEHMEGLMVIILYQIGKILEAKALGHSRKSIASLMDIKPEYANLKKKEKILKVNPAEVKIDSVILVKSGERIPLDGVVVSGKGKIDSSSLTGESSLINIAEGDTILSGSILNEGLIEMRVTSLYENSTVNRILDLVENATDKKAKTETLVSKLAKIYTPIVISLALLLVIIGTIFTDISFTNWTYKALTFLVISCPCSIAISVPLSYFIGIGVSAKSGVLIKGSNYLDALKDVKRIIFDKTGTITTGKFNSLSIEFKPSKYKEEYIKSIIGEAEKLSNHPIAKSILAELPKKEPVKITYFKEIKGQGLRFKVDKKDVKIGSAELCNVKDTKAQFYVTIEDDLVASVYLKDEIKKDAKSVIALLNDMGISTEIFTGDSKDKALELAKKLGIKDISYELLPDEKYNLLKERIDANNEKIAFIGDGINDAPSLALATIGISMGSIGSASAIEASDIVLMNDELSKIIDAIKISKRTSKIIKQNLIFSMSIKVLVLILSALGLANMWMAVFADVGVTLITIFNSLRIKI